MDNVHEEIWIIRLILVSEILCKSQSLLLTCKGKLEHHNPKTVPLAASLVSFTESIKTDDFALTFPKTYLINFSIPVTKSGTPGISLIFSSEKVYNYLQQAFSYLQKEKMHTYHQPLSLQNLQVQKFT